MKKLLVALVVLVAIAASADNPHITQLIELIDVAISAPANGDTLTFDSTVSKWVNKPVTQVPDGPKIVYRLNLLHQTDPINLPAFTAAEVGLYRISVSVKLVQPDVSGSFAKVVVTGDDYDPLPQPGCNSCPLTPFPSLVTVPTVGHDYNRMVGLMDLAAGGSVTISITNNVVYDASVVIEKL